MSIEEIGHYQAEKFFIALACILIASKIFGEIAERIKQPSVLGELIAGVILGSSVLAIVPSISGEAGYNTFHLLSEVGVAILLFEIGLETDLGDLLRVGPTSTIVAAIGVVAPFVLGFGSILAFEHFGMLGEINPAYTTIIAITVGATLTATSVGITARVFSDMNRLQSEEARIVLGAAVIDDILGLIILGVVTGLIEAVKSGGDGSISSLGVGIIIIKAIGFLVIAVAIGNLTSKKLFDLVNKMRVRGVLLLSALAFAFIFAYLASLFGLAPIVGAFAAGLVLAKTNQFNTIEERLKPVSDFFTPIFFIFVGAAVDVRLLNPFDGENIPILIIALVLFLVAILGKIISGLGVLKKGIKRSVIGIGMIPRGEVGLIFAQVGLTSGVFSSRLFSAVTVMVMLTTFIAPPLLKIFFSGDQKKSVN
ncbi:MAG: cation:proton antiporter [Thermodesulfobacteriota bacterium]